MKKVILSILIIFTMSACSNNVSDSSNCSDPTIKGNLTTHNGEKIYHVPGGQFYEVTDAEEMFCTQIEAIEAGYRKSKR